MANYIKIKRVEQTQSYIAMYSGRKLDPCKGNRSKAPGDSSVNYNLWNIVTTYLQEIPQRIR